jgi:CrcB protein
MIKNLLLVAVGGGVGSIARYVCQKWVSENHVHPFPWGTFVVNLAGCFLIGVVYAAAEKTTFISPQIRLLLITGFCGGFTTFSTFAFENMNLLRSNDSLYFLTYAVASVVLGIGAVFAGIAIIKFL